MHINWLGFSSFKIQNKENIIITDPYADKIGLKMPKLKGDIVVLSDPKNDDINNSPRISGDPFLIDKAGEYELKQTFIYGIRAGDKDQSHSMVYSIATNDLSVGFLGLLNHSLTDEQLKVLEGVDVLLLPVTSLTSERRTKIISQIEPRIIIPMYYKTPKVKPKLEGIEKFSKEMGIKKIDYQDKVILKAKDLPQDQNNVIFLKPTN